MHLGHIFKQGKAKDLLKPSVSEEDTRNMSDGFAPWCYSNNNNNQTSFC